jgi:hypothetical protein
MALTYRPQFRRGLAVWRFLARHQLLELILIIGTIMLLWAGATVGSAHL